MKINLLVAIAVLTFAVTGCMSPSSGTGPTTATARVAKNAKAEVKEGGGGDVVSQQFAGAVHRLPDTLQAFGVQLFPEVDLVQLKALVTDPQLHIEKIDEPILIQGARKDARNFADQKLIQVDGAAVTAILTQSDADEKLNALALHEILGLMKIESNDDYHISNRLLSNSRQSVECSDTKFEIADPAPSSTSTSTSTYVRVRFDFFRLENACILPADQGPRRCELTAYAGWVTAGENDVVEVSTTDYFGLIADFVTLNQGNTRHTYFSHDKGLVDDKQTLDFNVGTLDINWASSLKNSTGTSLYAAALTLKQPAKVIPVFCKINNRVN